MLDSSFNVFDRLWSVWKVLHVFGNLGELKTRVYLPFDKSQCSLRIVASKNFEGQLCSLAIKTIGCVQH